MLKEIKAEVAVLGQEITLTEAEEEIRNIVLDIGILVF